MRNIFKQIKNERFFSFQINYSEINDSFFSDQRRNNFPRDYRRSVSSNVSTGLQKDLDSSLQSFRSRLRSPFRQSKKTVTTNHSFDLIFSACNYWQFHWWTVFETKMIPGGMWVKSASIQFLWHFLIKTWPSLDIFHKSEITLNIFWFYYSKHPQNYYMVRRKNVDWNLPLHYYHWHHKSIRLMSEIVFITILFYLRWWRLVPSLTWTPATSTSSTSSPSFTSSTRKSSNHSRKWPG